MAEKVKKEINVNTNRIVKRSIIAVTALVLALFVFWYFTLFNLGPHQPLIWFAILLASVSVLAVILARKKASEAKQVVWPLALLIIGALLIVIPCGPLTSVNLYRHQINPEEVQFEQAVEPFDSKNVQTLDKTAAQSLGDRTFGTIGAEQISQYSVSDLYTQQVYQGQLVRVTPAEYNGFFTSLNGNGTPGYIIVNVVTGESRFVKVEGGLKYVPSAMFSKDLYRHVRFRYPFEILSSERFEINEEGHPYWIYTTYKAYGAAGRAAVPNGVITVDAVSGDVFKYGLTDAPAWIDQIYTASEIIDEYRNYGKYQKGVINSFTTKKGVLSTTDDYSYLMQDGQLYMYTGVTSASNDESNVGFIYVNLHTQKCSYISCVGAEEYSAKDAAEGAVQEKGYTSVFPTLVNVSGRPTYFLSLKDKTGLIKAYAFVDVVDYTKVKVTESEKGVKKALDNYLELVNGTVTGNSEREITVMQISAYEINGYSYFYITDENDLYYKASITVSDLLPFVKTGQKLTVTFAEDTYPFVITEIRQ